MTPDRPSEKTARRLAAIVAGQRRGDAIGGPTTMAGLLLASVESLGRFDATDVLARYLDWWKREGFDTGPVAAAVFERVAAGAAVTEAVAAVDRLLGGMTAGCAPVHRNVVLASVPFLDDTALEAAVRAEARLTHHHPLAAEAAVAAARLCRRLARGASWDEALECLARGLSQGIAGAVAGWREPPGDHSGYAPAVLHAALHFVGTSGDFAEALGRAGAFSGAANYVPVLAGAIAGARWGDQEQSEGDTHRSP